MALGVIGTVKQGEKADPLPVKRDHQAGQLFWQLCQTADLAATKLQETKSSWHDLT